MTEGNAFANAAGSQGSDWVQPLAASSLSDASADGGVCTASPFDMSPFSTCDPFFCGKPI